MTISRVLLATSATACLFFPPRALADLSATFPGGNKVAFEGLVQGDGNWFRTDNGALSDADNKFAWRRVELILKGKGPSNLDWVLGYDVKAEKFLDANVRWTFGEALNPILQLGQFKQPNSLEELTSVKYTDFIAKSSVTSTYALARRLGIGLSLGDDKWTVSGSVFGRELTRHLATGDGVSVRATYAPLITDEHTLHLGMSIAQYDADANVLQLRARPNADLSDVRLVDTGTMPDVDALRTVGTEALYLSGRFKVQAEYVTARTQRLFHRPHDSDGYYISGVWNLGGETWRYKTGLPATPKANNPAAGMWQLAARYDRLDLNDGHVSPSGPSGGAPVVDGVLGGKMATWTVGLSWFWRANLRTTVNYVKVDSQRYNRTAARLDDNNPSIAQARVQIYW